MWQNAIGELDDFAGVAFGGIETTNAKAVNGLIFHEVGRFSAKVLKKTTLNDGVKILFGLAGLFGGSGEFLMLGDIARKPIVSMAHGAFHNVVIARVGSLIESHVDVSADFPLCLHGNLWRHADFVAIDMGLECDAVVVNFDVRKRKHLKTTRVSERRCIPVGKSSKTAALLDKIWARSE